jgi:excisionase family DNA binding protein
MKDIMTVEDVAAYLQVTERTVRAAITDGKLKAYKQFGKWYIMAPDLIDFIRSEK